MSDFELFSAIMMVLAIVVKLVICLIEAKDAKKQPPQTKDSGYFVTDIQVSRSSAAPVFYSNNNKFPGVCPCMEYQEHF